MHGQLHKRAHISKLALRETLPDESNMIGVESSGGNDLFQKHRAATQRAAAKHLGRRLDVGGLTNTFLVFPPGAKSGADLLYLLIDVRVVLSGSMNE